MKKNVFFFLMCTFAIIGMTQAQNRGQIQLETTEPHNVMIAQDLIPTVGSWFSYVGDYSSPQIIGIGMPFSWGYMLPAEMMSEYKGCSMTQFGFLDAGEEQFATSYTINIYLGGGIGFQAGDFQVIVGYDHSLLNVSRIDGERTGRSQFKIGVNFVFGND